MFSFFSLIGYLGLSIVAIVVIGLIYLLFIHFKQTTKRSGEVEILPSSIPYLGCALEIAKRPIEFFIECKNKTTDIFGLLIAGDRVFIIHDPHSTQIITKINKALSIDEFFEQVTENLFEYHHEKINRSPHIDFDLVRKWYSQYLLSDKSLDILCERMMRKFAPIYRLLVTNQLKAEEEVAEETTATPVEVKEETKTKDKKNKSDEKKPAKPTDKKAPISTDLPLYDFIGRFVFHVAVGAVFNSEINDNPLKCDQLYDAFKILDKSVALCVAGFNIKHQSRAYSALKFIQDTLQPLDSDLSGLMQRRREYFLELSKDKEPWFAEHIGLINTPIFWASVANSMPAVFWLLYFVIQKGETLIKEIRQEIYSNINNYERFYQKNFSKDDTELLKNPLNHEELSKLLLIESCFTEAVRLTAGSLIMRVNKVEGLELELSSGKKYKFRKGDRIGLFPALFHFNEEIFPNHEEFNPYRFMKEDGTLEEKIAAANGKIPMSFAGKELNP
jgi:oxysterol 7-alpha-hydroxylase